ncbi:hypothetical protein GT347_26590 [Xylophilus rhododendri]|uniref:PEP-CTERM protein-sorting domain-containing protein n=1 Tax=Xylophilus rhododendri TaxID=2697032 RepID=A0A857JDF7_9BURK|nr:hypothetical protein [Xylophilus rhododendri]QHJ01244.1 hypothetical protein GT347_26590 [Xylophilus rhododendri]
MKPHLKHLAFYFVALGAATTHAAGITGDMVSIDKYYPDTSTRTFSMGTQSIDASGSTYDYFNDLTFIVAADTITVNFPVASNFSSAAFNGFIVTDLTRNFPFTYVLDPHSTLAGFTSADYSTAGNQFSVNIAGLRPRQGNTLIFTALAPVPEPETCGMLAAGLCIVAALTRPTAGRARRPVSSAA